MLTEEIRKSTIVDFLQHEEPMTLGDVEEEEKNFFYFCGKQQEFAAYRRRSIGRLHSGKAWKTLGIVSPVHYFKTRLGLGKARYHRIVQNDQTEREIVSRILDFEKEFVKDSVLEALREYPHGQQLLIVQEIQKRRRFFTQKEVTSAAECLGFKKISKKFGFSPSNSKEEDIQLSLIPLEEEDIQQLHRVAAMDEETDETTIVRAVRTYTKNRLHG